ncbi:mitotic spindle assembly checkpoint protein MAD1 isoform X3 [Mustela putorius furo]|uniref:Mitotic spindle assembly checkpoint protein MAD1 n=1 Tax=Mustela putorius furo TaxID=9669 RepID=A0A8U0NMB0_MUSPF|nr:mitotic spindle assembly checkpoint protein MAD1 isoform X3 [Mustela putorius furo]
MPAGRGATGPLTSGCWKRRKAWLCREGPVVSSKTSRALCVRSSGHTPRHLPQDLTTCVRVTPAHGCSQRRYPQLPELRHDWDALESGWTARPWAVRTVDGDLSAADIARGLEKARQQLQEEVRQVSSQLLEERKKRETQEALARRLQKRVLLLTKERDGMRAILGSYDSELTAAEYSPQLTRRMREAEDMVQKVHAHNSEMEAQLSQALEELGGQKQRADMLEMEVKMLQSQTSAAEQSFPLSREEASSLRLKIEELEGERSRLEEDKKMLEMQLERFTLQGGYDQSRTKVLHMSMNPASAAKQRLREDQARLQEECEQLRELVRALERGGPVPADLEAAASLPSSKELTELRKQVESAELKNQRLKEVFQTKIQEFRKVCYALTGYQIDITTENQYRLTSMYAEHKADCLIFKATGPSGAKMQLLETAFSSSVQELIELHLLRQDSIPAFLSALTLDLFSRQTVA